MRYGGNRMKQFFDEIRLEVIKAVKKDIKKILKQINKSGFYEMLRGS